MAAPIGFPQLDAGRMTAVLLICNQLGYDEAINAPTRGSTSLLLDDLTAIINNHPDVRLPEVYADIYLGQAPRGLKHNYFVWNGALPDSHLTWIKDSKK